MFPLQGLLAGTDGRIENDAVGTDRGLHGCKETQGQLPLSALLTCGDGGTEAYQVWLDGCLAHGTEHVQSRWPVKAFLAAADGCIPGDKIWATLRLRHLLKEVQRHFPLPALLTGADQRCEADHIWPNFCGLEGSAHPFGKCETFLEAPLYFLSGKPALFGLTDLLI